jgi:ADP-dependent NAD(P)H-hydrate dehydratase / NAD(P)H-hydrate epimerase
VIQGRLMVTKSNDALYLSGDIKAFEAEVIKSVGLDATQLMHRAGAGAFKLFKKHYHKIKHVAVFCGSGNNAGDGYEFARLAHEAGLSVIIYQAKAIEDLPNTAQHAALLAIASGVVCQSVEEALDADTEIIIDALLGTGLKGSVFGVIANAVNQINLSGLPVIALDIPSGVNADTGHVAHVGVKATYTITFIAQKPGLYTADGPDYSGVILCDTLGLDLKDTPTSFATLLTAAPISLPKRKKNVHKGAFGHVLVIGGDLGMPGAIGLCAKAALRAGAGSVTIATHPEHESAFLSFVPEAMSFGIDAASCLEPLFKRATFCVIGPGLGDSAWASMMYQAAITAQLPMLIDASALGILATFPQSDDNWILTPHPGEAAKLLSTTAAEVQRDRFQAALAIHKQYGGVVVLKGNGTVIYTDEHNLSICPHGNPGMASSGMGDVLSGIIAGLCAQGLSLSQAAQLGVWAHGQAGDIVSLSQGSIGLLASDLLPILPKILCDLD